jgi:hypothetical protein
MSTSGGKSGHKFALLFKRVKYSLIGEDLEVKMVKNEQASLNRGLNRLTDCAEMKIKKILKSFSRQNQQFWPDLTTF